MGEWIYCNDRLPEEDGCYLVAISEIDDVMIYFYNEDAGGWTGPFYNYVYAWMSLPQMPTPPAH